MANPSRPPSPPTEPDIDYFPRRRLIRRDRAPSAAPPTWQPSDPDTDTAPSPSPPPFNLFTTDTDAFLDSEVMIRTAQASRLRRRGAIRIEGRAPATVTTSRREPLTDTEWDTAAEESSPSPIISFVVRHTILPDDFVVDARALYCGGVVAPKRRRPASNPTAFRPSPLPGFSSSCSSQDTSEEEFPSTGCGALVHPRASASERLSVWLANTGPTRTVASLEASYVEPGPQSIIRLGTAKCGCVHEGIGCRSCGNSLGMRVRHCDRHRHHHMPITSSRSDEKPAVTYVFNPFNVTHSRRRAIPFPYDITPSPATSLPPSPVLSASPITSPTVPAPRMTFRPIVYSPRRPHQRRSIPNFSLDFSPPLSSSSSSSNLPPSSLPFSICPAPPIIISMEEDSPTTPTPPPHNGIVDPEQLVLPTGSSSQESTPTSASPPPPPPPPVVDEFDEQITLALRRMQVLHERLDRILAS